jgi:hypothetical protein
MFRHKEREDPILWTSATEESAKVAEIAKMCSTLVLGSTSGVPFTNTLFPIQERKSAKRHTIDSFRWRSQHLPCSDKQNAKSQNNFHRIRALRTRAPVALAVAKHVCRVRGVAPILGAPATIGTIMQLRYSD